MPCYNEEHVVAYTIHRLTEAFASAGHVLELIAVDNGSTDGTGMVLHRIAQTNPSLRIHRVEINRGYGHGVRSGIPLATAPWVGMIPADGQVDAEDVVRLYEMAVLSGDQVVAKVRRRFRMDGPMRKLTSLGYNLVVRALWPTIVWDVNGVPKILSRGLLDEMALTSEGWALEPEIIVKAHAMGIRIVELNILSRERSSGRSKVLRGAAWELFVALLRLRFSPEIKRLRKHNRAMRLAPARASMAVPQQRRS
jgi:glycosyltransferase involved in cell wall biosynthesis